MERGKVFQEVEWEGGKTKASTEGLNKAITFWVNMFGGVMGERLQGVGGQIISIDLCLTVSAILEQR